MLPSLGLGFALGFYPWLMTQLRSNRASHKIIMRTNKFLPFCTQYFVFKINPTAELMGSALLLTHMTAAGVPHHQATPELPPP